MLVPKFELYTSQIQNCKFERGSCDGMNGTGGFKHSHDLLE
jgi:hypothetical protein